MQRSSCPEYHILLLCDCSPCLYCSKEYIWLAESKRISTVNNNIKCICPSSTRGDYDGWVSVTVTGSLGRETEVWWIIYDMYKRSWGALIAFREERVYDVHVQIKKVGVCGQMECVYVQISCSWAVCGVCTSGCCKAVYRRSQMKAKQFEAGNEWCPLSFRQHSNRSVSHAWSFYASHMQVGESKIRK